MKVLFLGLSVFCAPPCIVIRMFESYLVIEEGMYDVTVGLKVVFFLAVFYFVVFCFMAPESLVGVPALGEQFLLRRCKKCIPSKWWYPTVITRKTTFSVFTAVKILNYILDIFCLNIIRIRHKSPLENS